MRAIDAPITRTRPMVGSKPRVPATSRAVRTISTSAGDATGPPTSTASVCLVSGRGGRLTRFAVGGVGPAVGAELLQLQPVGVVAPVLLRDVVAVLALVAGQGDLRPDVGGCHGADPSSSAFEWTY